MRNLLQYPLDSDESFRILETLIEDLNKNIIPGDMRSFALGKILEFLKTQPKEVLDEALKI